MDRRQFLLGTAAGAGLSALAGTLAAAPAALAAPVGGGAGGAGESADALGELLALLREIDARYLGPEWGVTSPEDVAEGRSYVMHVLMHALDAWHGADPARPRWTRFTQTSKKLLGDNPDALYYSAPVDPARRYRIRGNLAGAVYTSFTVEAGTAEGRGSKGAVAALNDSQFEVRADGSYELVASADPQPGNWLRLAPEAGSLTTRHYFEWQRSACADPALQIPLSIEPLDDPGPSAPPDDASAAAGLRRVANFVRACTLEMPLRKPEEQPPWVSREPNRFPKLRREAGNSAIGFAAVDNVYCSSRFELAPDEALVIRGRYPRCRFANVVLWNRFTQSFDYTTRRISLNRRQTRLEPDGSFRMVIAPRDPGLPNWLDSEGRRSGTIFWRFQLPEEEIQPLKSEVVPISKLEPA